MRQGATAPGSIAERASTEPASRLLLHATGGGLGHLSRQIALAREIRSLWPTTDVLLAGQTSYGSIIAPDLPFVPFPSSHELQSVAWTGPQANRSPLHDLVAFTGIADDQWNSDREGAPGSLVPAIVSMLDMLFATYRPGAVVHDTLVWSALFDAAARAGAKQAIVLRKRRDLLSFANHPKSPVAHSDLLILPYERHEVDEILQALPANRPPTICIGRVVRAPSHSPRQVRRRLKLSRSAPLIVVTSGGGGFPEVPEFYRSALDALEAAVVHQPRCEHQVVLVLGPRYEGPLPAAPNLDLRVLSTVAWMPDLIAAASLVICQAGYNTLADVAATGVPTIVEPGERTHDDQAARASEIERDQPNVRVLIRGEGPSMSQLVASALRAACTSSAAATRPIRHVSPKRDALSQIVKLGEISTRPAQSGEVRPVSAANATVPPSYPVIDGKLRAPKLEIGIVENCNLACRSCSHLSPVLAKHHVSVSDISRDLAILHRHYHARSLRLLGGEPLLHPHLVDLIDMARASGIADSVCVVTNGVLLPRMRPAFWQAVDRVEVSLYPGHELTASQKRECRQRARLGGTVITFAARDEFRQAYSEKGTSDPALVRAIYDGCQIVHKWRCHTLANGRFYKCPQSYYLSKVIDDCSANAIDDSVRIDDSPALGLTLRAYLESPNPLATCGYCLGTAGSRFAHTQVRRSEFRALQGQATEELVDATALRQDHGGIAFVTPSRSPAPH
jgi:uncharacterized radical SAM superfamily Fe-S cluster-containing enzyme